MLRKVIHTPSPGAREVEAGRSTEDTEQPHLLNDELQGHERDLVSKEVDGGWRDGSATKSTCCSSKELWFGFELPQGGLQPSLSIIPGKQYTLLTCKPQAHKIFLKKKKSEQCF